MAPQNERGGTIVSTVQRLIYVSCGFKSFQRDASVLLGLSPPRDPLIEVGISDKATGSGGQTDPSQAGQGGSSAWRLVHAEGHVLFPGSDHIETLAIFDRKT